ncbi:hypothetical protein SprV_0401486100 [Sparganum proliferum]
MMAAVAAAVPAPPPESTKAGAQLTRRSRRGPGRAVMAHILTSLPPRKRDKNMEMGNTMLLVKPTTVNFDHGSQADPTITPTRRAKENETMLLANKLRQSMKKLQKSAENLLVRVRSSSRDPPLPPPPPQPQKCVRDIGQSHHRHRHHQVVTRHSARDPTAKRRHRSLSVNSPQEMLGVPTPPATEEGQFNPKYRERSEEPTGNRSDLLLEDPHKHL